MRCEPLLVLKEKVYSEELFEYMAAEIKLFTKQLAGKTSPRICGVAVLPPSYGKVTELFNRVGTTLCHKKRSKHYEATTMKRE